MNQAFTVFLTSALIQYIILTIFRHHRYDGADNDIAILKTKEKIRFGEFVQPACRATSKNWKFYQPGTKVVVSGWGYWKKPLPPTRKRPTSDYPNILQAAEVVVYDFKKCKKNYLRLGRKFMSV